MPVLQHAGNDLQALAGQFPALFPDGPCAVPAAIVAALNNLQNQIQNNQAALLQRLDRIDARMANGGYDHDELNDPVVWPPHAPGAPALPPPAAWPGTWDAVLNLTAAQLRPYLLAYGLGVGGNMEAKQQRLQRHLGLRLNFNPNA